MLEQVEFVFCHALPWSEEGERVRPVSTLADGSQTCLISSPGDLALVQGS